MTAAKRRPTRRRDRAGFLLTETLATFTISAFVLLGLLSASSVLLHAVDRSVAHVQDVDDLGRTISAIRRDVSSLARARWNGFEPQAFVFRGGPNSLFFALAQTDVDGTRETRVVALREIVAGGGTRLMRGEARLPAKATGFDDLRYGPQRELGTGTARLRFSYVMPVREETKPARRSEWPVGAIMPSAIIIDAVEHDSGRLILSARVPIRADADIGCLAQGNGGQPPLAAALAGRANPPPTGGSVTSASGAIPAAAPLTFCGRIEEPKPRNDLRKISQPQAASWAEPPL